MILKEFISAILQVFVFSLIPFIVFIISKKQINGFFRYIGLFKPLKETTFLAIITSVILIISGIILPLISPEIKELMTTNTTAGNLKAMGLSYRSVIILAIVALISTSLSEEIFFRGFIAKRLIKSLGFKIGNSIQSILFGLVHVALFIIIFEPPFYFLAFIFIFSGTAGFIMGYMKEELGNGSIIPGWIAHGLGNFISFFLLAFVI